MQMVRLIYTSEFTKLCSDNQVREIVDYARKYNVEVGITGLLCYAPQGFIQWIEGEREEVSRLFLTISKDPRHDQLIILEYSEITERAFEMWPLAYVSTLDVSRHVLMKYGLEDQMAFTELTGEGAKKLLLHLSLEREEYLHLNVSE